MPLYWVVPYFSCIHSLWILSFLLATKKFSSSIYIVGTITKCFTFIQGRVNTGFVYTEHSYYDTQITQLRHQPHFTKVGLRKIQEILLNNIWLMIFKKMFKISVEMNSITLYRKIITQILFDNMFINLMHTIKHLP